MAGKGFSTAADGYSPGRFGLEFGGIRAEALVVATLLKLLERKREGTI
jgi:hypothetical protein